MPLMITTFAIACDWMPGRRQPASRNPAAGLRRRLGVACLVLAAIFAAPPDAPAADTFGNLQRQLLDQKPDLDRFRAHGPFAVTTKPNHDIRLSAKERIPASLYLAAAAGKAPLVIFLHGHDSSKEAHALQAMNVASWGLHALAVQLSKTGPWDGNGRTLARIVNLIHRTPGIIDDRVDASRILLVGHSFGAYAVTVAMAQGAPVAGAILLDPALFGNASPEFMRRISRPVMVVAADEVLSPVRHREYFFHYIPAPVAEVSVRDATHEDAQYPSEDAVQNGGVDPDVTEALQITFASAITSTAFSLAAGGSLDYAWAGFDGAIRSGRLLQPKRK